MHFSQLVASCLLGLATSSLAEIIPADHYLWGPGGAVNNAKLEKRATTTTSSASTTSRVADSACTNGALTRSCWSSGYSVATDFDSKWPTTGQTRSYTLTATNTTCNPDGNGDRICLLYNNQYPGPTIWGNWGDTISVTVKNEMQDNGTSIHWHGIRQLNSNTQDGVNGITECPLAPGDSKTYTFKATQFGTSWYHSHFSAQYGDGLVGPIVIYGPSSSNYDVDLGPFTVSDWYYKTAFQMEAISNVLLQQASPPPPADNILVNGTGKNTAGAGSYTKYTMTKNKKYLLRLINTSVDNNIRVSLDGHNLTVIAGDFVPVKPITKQWVLLGIGQRYEVIITANQAVGNYWFRAEVAADCASANNNFGRAIFSYTGAASGDPTTTAYDTPTTGCVDESPLVPWVTNTVPSTNFISQAKELDVNINVEQITTNNQSIVVWGINMTAIDIDWEKPTLEYIKTQNTSYPSAYNLVEIPNGQTWTYWIIQETGGANTPIPIPHPIHLHGHDFYILGSGSGVFDPSSQASSLAFNNPYRRDVTFLPGGGWVVIAFPTDNPGAWLMHCHIAWHVSQGLGVQFLESKASINLPDSTWEKTCTNWATYWDKGTAYPKSDSGL
ncbi:putative multicopper oxidase, type 1 [Rhizodiscina lignyota]|uniref:laccase n=1 Tax=Rhizodiscina lignyota TaxID=1504668 RepID=A0A9P4MFN6_9PEZI|nr:putative multicopper oxidase, type 1 [Rhizodiscina lignyota]